MVFTVRVRRAEHGLSRRGVLAAAVGGLAAAGLGGCDIGSTTALWHLAPDKLLPFLASTVALADTYDAAMRRLPALTAQLTPLRDDHRQHVTALRRELGLVETAPSQGPTPTSGGTVVDPAPSDPTLPDDHAGLIAVLRTAERKGQQDAVAACLAAPSYRAALLGSIAACRATHLTVLG